MSENQRKLLPYEYQLIEALNITREEYLDFVAQQHIHSDIKDGSIVDIRNEPLTVISAVLTVVGIIFQVVAALTAPEEKEKGQAGTRDDRFAPRTSFNSVQDLAKYGDPINLVYTNYDKGKKQGGVRMATSLLWSAMQSYGNSQLVQLMFLIGAGKIGEIDETRIAFGQIGMRDFIAQNYWIYFAADRTGALKNSDLLDGLSGLVKTKDPTKSGGASSNPYRVRASADGGKVDGFSHAYSPTSSNTFGVYGVVPINIDWRIRDEQGDVKKGDSKITIKRISSSGNEVSGWPSGSGTISVNNLQYKILLAKIPEDPDSESLANREASEARQALSSVFDSAGTLKLGSAIFKITSVNRSNVVDGAMVVKMLCIQDGHTSSVGYNDKSPADVDNYIDVTSSDVYNSVKKEAEALISSDLTDAGFLSPVDYVKKASREYKEQRARDILNRGYITIRKQTITSVPNYSYNNYRGYYGKANQLEQVKLTKAQKSTLREYIGFQKLLDAVPGDDLFYLKAVTRIEKASYDTVSPCNVVDFSIKAQVFKVISGRQEEYGSDRKDGYSASDNGTKARTAMFIMKYKKASEADYYTVPGIFVVRRAASVENYIYLRFDSGTTGVNNAEHWQFLFEPIFDPRAEALTHSELRNSNGRIIYHYLENSADESKKDDGIEQINLKGAPFIEYAGKRRLGNSATGMPPINITPEALNEWDLFTSTSDEQIQFSFDNGPEFSISTVTEQIKDSFDNYSKLYDDMSLIGLNMYSGKSVQDLRSFSVFVTKGRRCKLLRTRKDGAIGGIQWGQEDYPYLPSSANGYPNTAPDIFTDSALDKNDGIGQYANIQSLDLKQLSSSKLFCIKNNLFMDGVIADATSWRSFWSTVAGFSLLELAKIGGQDTLIPALPYSESTGAITTDLKISALFNPGNIIEGSYKEDFLDYGTATQDAIVTVVYRELDANGMFPIKKSVDVQLSSTRLKDSNGKTVDNPNIARETIDTSDFVTRRDQAIKIGKFVCQSRRRSRRAVEFRTFPTDSPIFPGAYIYLETAQNEWRGIYTGIIGEDGYLDTPLAPSIPAKSGYSVLVYKHGGSSTKLVTEVTVADNRAEKLTQYAGYLFVLGTSIRNKRVFKVTEVTMDEEGEVSVKGVEHAVDSEGKSVLARGIGSFVSGLFLIDGVEEESV